MGKCGFRLTLQGIFIFVMTSVARVSYLACVILSWAFAAPVNFKSEDCGASTTHAHLKSLTTYPQRPSTGEPIHLTAHMTVDEDITGGLFEVQITAGGYKRKLQVGSVCNHNLTFPVYWTALKVADVAVYGLPCPISKPRATAPVNFDIKLAKINVPGFSDFVFT